MCSFLQKNHFVVVFLSTSTTTQLRLLSVVCGWFWCDPEFLLLQLLGDIIEFQRLKLKTKQNKKKTSKAESTTEPRHFLLSRRPVFEHVYGSMLRSSGPSPPDRVRVIERAETCDPGASRA